MNFDNEQQLLEYTKSIIGKKFKEIDSLNLFSNPEMIRDKGILGKVVETGFYHYPLNNKSEADFRNLGIELKTVGFIRNKNSTIRAKERVSLSMINYMDIINEKYEFSKLVFKNKKILIIWYEYTKGKKEDFTIYFYQLYDMKVDEIVIKNDFNTIKQKVVDGLAHQLSEGDTAYLGAATKGNGQTKAQPNSHISAKSRAFSLKRSYMNGILESRKKIQEKPKQKSIEEFIYTKIKPYIGMTQLEIWEIIRDKNKDKPYSIKNVPKNINKMISDRIIGKDEKLVEIDDIFTKTKYNIKNISFEKNGVTKERVAFRNLRHSEFQVEWEKSELKQYFEEVTILFICYEGCKGDKNGERKLKQVKKVSFINSDLDNFKISYEAVKDAIKSKDISKLPYPKKFKIQYLEVAPKGKRGDEAYNNFFKSNKTKTCFMLEKNFISKKINI